MRLLHTETLQFHEFFDANIPPYAILSHRWAEGEVAFKEMRKGKAQPGPGLTKIEKFCTLAASKGHEWAWIDTCCIDKRSSAELSESINAMYKWYKNARACYVYLIDFALSAQELKHLSEIGVDALHYFVHRHKLKTLGINYADKFDLDFADRLRKCSWFKRGWTLQELLAPSTFKVFFFDKHWDEIGPLFILKDVISSITGIQERFLSPTPVAKPSVAQRMSWASGRHTSRGEDLAYCLLGLFNVNMPLLYGEGADNAFRRLQIEIMNRDDDESLFAWKSNKVLSGMLAESPRDFAESGDIIRTSSSRSKVYSMTQKGLSFPVPQRCVVESPIGHSWIALHCHKESYFDPIILHFCSVETSTFRMQCKNWQYRIRPSDADMPGIPESSIGEGVIYVKDEQADFYASSIFLEFSSKGFISQTAWLFGSIVIWDPVGLQYLPYSPDSEIFQNRQFEDCFC
ncbi:MAG: hypothetical protein Q9193_003796 [Seirophora villosa]